MIPDITTGLFALMIAGVSLYRILAASEFYRLTMMKRVYGRKRGLSLYFIVNVALPILLGIVFLTGGVSGRSFTSPLQTSDFPVLNFNASDSTEPFEEDWLRYPDRMV